MCREFHIYKIWFACSTGRTMSLEPTKCRISGMQAIAKKLPSLTNTSQVKSPRVQLAAYKRKKK